MSRARCSWFGTLRSKLCLIGMAVGSFALLAAPLSGEEPAKPVRLLRLRKVVPAPVAKVTAEQPTAPNGKNATAEAPPISETPSHRQTTIIQANVEGQPQVSITSFCLTPDDRILAGCTGQSGEIRVFDKQGKFVETWSLPVQPDAIFARADGTIFVAGEGQLAQLSKSGRILLQKQSPHASELNANPEQLREQIRAQAKQRAEMMTRQTKQFDDMIARSDKEITSLNEQLASVQKLAEQAENSREDGDADKPATSVGRAKARLKQIERRIAMHEQRKTQYEAVKAQWAEMIKQNPPAELTDEQIDAQVKASLAQTMKVSSISATDDEVYLATRAAAGYGFQIWRMDNEFENAASIVKELRGCCGQMDVKANANGVFVAENARHRVCRYDREGTLVTAWGESARNGLDGFGSCCNPMNVAFGPDDVVYTAEDNTGRIKRYSPDGKLLSLVGSVDLVPGCKNCSIAVNADGSQVYMLDITRNHIVRMDQQPASESTPASDGAKTASLRVEAP